MKFPKPIRAWAVVSRSNGRIYQEEMVGTDYQSKNMAIFAEMQLAELYCDNDISKIVEVEIRPIQPKTKRKK